MAATIASVFSTEAISERVDAFKENSLAGTTWTNIFNQGRKILAPSDDVAWDELVYPRALAPSVGRGTPAPVRPNLPRTTRRSAPCVLKVAKVIPGDLLFRERSPGSLLPNAQAVMEQEERTLVTEILNALEYLAASAALGTTTVNNTTMPGTTIPFTVAWGNATYSATAAWSTPGTALISSELFALKTAFEQSCGMPPERIVCGGTVEQYVAGNTEVQNLLSREGGIQLVERAAPLRGAGIAGFKVGGLDWQVTEQGYVPDGGAFTRYMPTTDLGVVLPASRLLPDVLGWIEGPADVPIAPYAQMSPGDPMAALGLMRQVMGWSAFAMLIDGPAIKLVVQYCGLPIIVQPRAIMVADTVP